jgi:hypothetical protein
MLEVSVYIRPLLVFVKSRILDPAKCPGAAPAATIRIVSVSFKR